MKTAEVADKLFEGGVHVDLVFKRAGLFTAKRSYFYRMDRSAEKLAAAIKRVFPGAIVVEAFDDYASWPKTSHFVVKFRLA